MQQFAFLKSLMAILGRFPNVHTIPESCSQTARFVSNSMSPSVLRHVCAGGERPVQWREVSRVGGRILGLGGRREVSDDVEGRRSRQPPVCGFLGS
ncbi:hypothetical protein KFK09_018147 [Dendrobium nobile]|uniref:Uncharacterized protein n=1 Tax=Dendrobium nobile TaxID=94219 RepID=A0A8T3AUG4_DENNO|nr:hypothetical protein KFK09_018147 [Dendrobium nobile]